MNCDVTGFELQDILFLIGVRGRSGELVLESGNNIGTIIFHEGNVLQAFSPYSRAIGDLLVEQGFITETELIETLLEQKRTGVSPIGSLFTKSGKVSFTVIERLVHEQIRKAINEFSAWQQVRASFVEKLIKPYDAVRIPVIEFILPEIVNSAKVFLSFPLPILVETPSNRATASHHIS